MIRILLGLLLLGGGWTAVAGDTPTPPDPEIRSVSETRFAFDFDGTAFSVDILDHVLRGHQDILLDWIVYSAKTVHQYYGRFPVDNVHINLQVTDGQMVRFGQAFGGDNPLLRVVVGENVTAENLRRDWIMVHEMVHLALANIPFKHRWLSEGLATYIESIARAQRKHLEEDFIWFNFIKRMPQGLPQSGDRGLDRTPTWGRTYWGGAIFCMLADIEIRKLTDNRLSLQDATRGILDAGYSMHADATAMQVLTAADQAIGVDVLVPLYEKMRFDPYPVDLDDLWRQLGVSQSGESVAYDDEAPLAHVRKRLLKS